LKGLSFVFLSNLSLPFLFASGIIVHNTYLNINCHSFLNFSLYHSKNFKSKTILSLFLFFVVGFDFPCDKR